MVRALGGAGVWTRRCGLRSARRAMLELVFGRRLGRALGSALALLAVLFAPAVPCRAQSPQKIVDEYIRAVGGAKALESVHTESIGGSVAEKRADSPANDDADESSGTYSLIVKAPNKFYSEMGGAAGRVVVAYNGKSAWEKRGGEAASTLTGANAARCEAEARYLNGKLVHMKREKFGARLVEIADVHSQPAYHIELTLSPSVKRDVYFDRDTHLLVREIVPAITATNADGAEDTNATEQLDYFYYHPVQGVQEPQQIELTRGGKTFRISVAQVEINPEVSDAIFNFPSTDNRPLPDIPQLLRDVNQNQRAIEALQKLYTCHLSAEEEKIDSRGEVTSRSVKEYDVFYVGEDEVRRLVAKDGKPLEGDEKKKEEERFSKEFDELKKKQVELENDPKKQAKQEESDEEAISDFLRAESFTNPRREIFRGHEVIVFDFAANPEYKPRNLAEQVAQKLGGVVWVDEQARDVARLEARFLDSAKIGGGIVGSLSKGSNFVFEQARINEEVWMPSYTEVHAAARVVFVKFKANEIDRYSDYKKFGSQVKLGVSTPLDQPAGAAPSTNAPAPNAPPPPPPQNNSSPEKPQ
jgi:hypothetical protein